MLQSIENIRQLFFNAYQFSSFDPEKRVASNIADFSAELESDLKELKAPGNYEEKYIRHLSIWLCRKSRCMSTMITGPANFPVAKNRKACNSTDKAWHEFKTWRERYIKRANAERTKSPEEEIDLALAELDAEKEHHEMLLIVSKIFRKKITADEKLKQIKADTAFDDKVILDWFKNGFASYQLPYSNTRIKRLTDKLTEMRKRVAVKISFEPIEFEGGSITIENDRVCVKHDKKPMKETIEALRRSGFRWSPHWNCWVRKHTAQAIRSAKQITGVNNA